MATLHDIATIKSIAYDTWPDTYKTILTSDALDYMLQFFYAETALEKQMKAGQQFFIVYLKNTPIGFGAISQQTTKVYKLNKLYVLPAMQKTGAGKMLMNFAVDLAKTQGGLSFILNVNRNNPAKFFYEKRGFNVLKNEDVDLGDGIIQEDYVMGIDLKDYRY